jgi:ribonuclease HI
MNIRPSNNPSQLRIWQQNLNRSFDAQTHLLHCADPSKWDVLLLQEPYIDFLKKTRSNPYWRVIYPDIFYADHSPALRSVILVNTNLPTDCWEAVQIPSTDITAVKFTTTAGTVTIFNIYNSCTDNNSTTLLDNFLSSYAPNYTPSDDHHLLWCGDFNRHHPMWEGAHNSHLYSSDANVQPLLDLVFHYDMIMQLPPEIPTLEALSTGNWTRPDNVWCSSHTSDRFISCNVDPSLRPPHTDHLPIISVIDFSVTRAETTKSRNFRLVDWEEFTTKLKEILDANPSPRPITNSEEFDTALRNVSEALTATIDSCVPLSKSSPFSKRWWTRELGDMCKRKNRLNNLHFKYRGAPDHPSHQEFRDVNLAYTKLIKATKSQHWEEWLENASSKDLWTANKYISDPPTDGGKTRIPTLHVTNSEGTLTEATTNDQKAAALIQSFFPPPPDQPIVPPSQYPEPVAKLQYFTRQQIRDATAKLKPHKAPGPDGIPNVVLMKCIDLLINHLYFIFRAIIELHLYPEAWKVFLTVVLRKPGKPAYDIPKAYRPIALMITLAKLFSSLLASFLIHLCESNNLLPANQFGGRPGRMTTDSMHILVQKVKEAWRRKQVATALFLDVQGAFPNVVKEVLIHNMRMKGVPEACTDIARLMLTGRQTRLRFDDYVSDPIPIYNGNSQGDPLSMIFYFFYNYPLIASADPSSKNETILGFVDDVALLATGSSFTDTHRKLKSMMERTRGCFDWSWSHNSPLELSKLAIMDFSLKKRTGNDLTLTCPRTGKSTTVKSTQKYKFLGVLFEPNLRWTTQSESAIATSSRWINLVRRLARVSTGISAKLMRQLYIAVAIPRMTYAADVWYIPPYKATVTSKRRQGSVTFTDKLRSIQRQALITILGAMRTTAGDALEAHAFVLPIHLLFLKVCHRAAVRLATLPSSHPLHSFVRRASQRFVKRHKSSLHHLFHSTKVNPTLFETILPVRRRPNYRPYLTSTIDDDRDKAKKQADDLRAMRVVVYADGSGYKGGIGAAASLWVNGRKTKTLRFFLGKDSEHTVYEAEIIGVILGLQLLKSYSKRIKETVIGIDNQAVIQALQNQKPKSGHYLLDKVHDMAEDFQMAEARKRKRGEAGYRMGGGITRNALGGFEWKTRRFKKCSDLSIQWIPGHSGLRGNEEVDTEAKRAAEGFTSRSKDLPPFLRGKPLPLSASSAKQSYYKQIRNRWANEWKLSPRYRKLKYIDSSLPSKKFIQNTSSLSRVQTSLLVQLRTGHLPLNLHLFRIKRADSPSCTHCGDTVFETVFHYLIQCPHYRHERHLLARKLKRRALSMRNLLNDNDALLPLLSYVHSTSRLRSTFGAVEPQQTQ